MEVKEAYCSHEISKLLKEKGFDIPTLAFYWSEKSNMYQIRKNKVIIPDNQERNWNEATDVMYSCPTHQMACAWVRGEYDIDMWVEYCIPDDAYVYTILIKNVTDGFTIIHSENNYPTYEEAVESALKYILTNLII